MTEQEKKPEVKVQEKAPETPKEGVPQQAQQISVKQIFDIYPVDRERARDYVLMGIQNELMRIGNALENLLRFKVARAEERRVKEQVEKGAVPPGQSRSTGPK